MIRQAVRSDLDTIYELAQFCAKAMITKKKYQWDQQYPTSARFEKDIELQESYVLEQNHQVTGTIVVTELIDDEYIPVQWLTDNKSNVYIHRLAVQPQYWRTGYAQQLMDWAEVYAKNQRYQSVRLDTLSQNKRIQNFYETRGYQKSGSIFFHNRVNTLFTVMN